MNHLSIRFWAILLALSLTNCQKERITGDLIISNVNIIDVENGTTNEHQTLAITDEKITSITPFSEDTELISESVIDGTGKFMIPGLWDMHVHGAASNEDNMSALFIPNGVLGVRDMHGDLKVRDYMVKSKTIAPKIFLSGAILYGDMPGFNLNVKDPEEAVRLVDSLHTAGADFIKVYDFLSKDMLDAIAKRCQELNMPFAGHVSMEATPVYVSELGQRSIEHLSGIDEYISQNRKAIDSLEPLMMESYKAQNIPGFLQSMLVIGNYMTQNDDEKLNELAEVFKKNNTYMVPTLSVIHSRGSLDSFDGNTLEHKEYMPKELLASWELSHQFPFNMFSPNDWEMQHKLVELADHIVKNLNDKGVPILAGTDCTISSVIPGFSLHGELDLLVQAGLTNAEALKTATINPARYFEIEDSYGIVSEQKVADLVLLDRNPLENIENTKSIHAVIQNGTYYNRSQLDAMLEKAVIKDTVQ